MAEKTDVNRRKMLTTTTALVGGIGIGSVAVPFIRSMLPSAKAKALGAGVEVDVSDLQPGELRVTEWRGNPVWILRRTPGMLRTLETSESRLKDPHSELESQQPAYAKNRHRSIDPEFLVVMGICTHLGCSPNYMPEHGLKAIGDWWKGGFFCPCHQSEYDLAGRVFKGRSPAPMNLPVPPHRFVGKKRILIGEHTART